MHLKPIALFALLPAFALATPVREVRDVKPFTKLVVGGDVEVIVREGERSIVAEGEPSHLKELTTDVAGDTLRISINETWRPKQGERSAKVTVSGYTLGAVRASGATTVMLTAPTEPKLALEASGAATIDAPQVAVQDLSVDASGAAKLNLAGASPSSTIEASGAATVNATKLDTMTLKVTGSGAAKAKVLARTSIVANASGASGIEVSGNPKERVVERAGVASVRF